MLSIFFFVVGSIFTLVYGWGFLSRIEYKTHTNLRIIIFWLMALGFFLVHSVSGIHLIYTFPLGIGLAFLGVGFVARGREPKTVLIISGIIWSFFLMAISDIFGTFV